MDRIKPGDPQPVECPKCKAFHGYQHHDNLYLRYFYVRDTEGSLEREFYSDSVNILHKGVTTYCANCITKLPFKLIK